MSSQIIKKYSQIIEANHQEYFNQITQLKTKLKEKHNQQMKETLNRHDKAFKEVVGKHEKELNETTKRLESEKQ